MFSIKLNPNLLDHSEVVVRQSGHNLSSFCRAAVAVTGLVLAIVGIVTLSVYSQTPGSKGVAPALWPTSSSLQIDSTRLNLIMFLHPHCPCSRNSVDELEK